MGFGLGAGAAAAAGVDVPLDDGDADCCACSFAKRFRRIWKFVTRVVVSRMLECRWIASLSLGPRTYSICIVVRVSQ